MRQRLRHHGGQARRALSKVQVLAAMATILGCLAHRCLGAVGHAFIQCQHVTRRVRACSSCSVLRAEGRDVQMMEFGKYKSSTREYVARTQPSYCNWALQQEQANCPELIAFKKFLREIGFERTSKQSSRPKHSQHWKQPTSKQWVKPKRLQPRKQQEERTIQGWVKMRRRRITQSRSANSIAQSLGSYSEPHLNKPGKQRPKNKKLRNADVDLVRIRVDLASYDLYKDSSLLNRLCMTDDEFKADFRNQPYHRILCKYIDQQVQRDGVEPGVGWASVRYRQDELGQRLVEKGLIKGARVYGGRRDPFHLPSLLNELLTDKFYLNLDDSKAHHYYMRALTQNPDGILVLDEFLTNADLLMEEIAEHYFSNSSLEFTKKVKTLLHSLAMDGSVGSWRNRQGVHEGIVEHSFVSRFAAVMPKITQEFAQMPAGKEATALIRKDFPDRTHPGRTWKSFLLQELEFVSREAKRVIANKYEGHGSLEHDGIKILRGTRVQSVSEEDLERELRLAATKSIHDFVQYKYGRNNEGLILPVLIKPASFMGE
mmetsp:Transcript_53283/g.105953  ORF Transcript_53283/g.105953 Transcript_53283/m.105953 type:complete len:543 (-) Transcript_53283:211-1839(-)